MDKDQTAFLKGVVVLAKDWGWAACTLVASWLLSCCSECGTPVWVDKRADALAATVDGHGQASRPRRPGGFVRTQGSGQFNGKAWAAQFNGKACELEEWVEDKGRWRVAIFAECGEARRQKLFVRPQNLRRRAAADLCEYSGDAPESKELQLFRVKQALA